MDVKSAYDLWSETYDSDINKTRDLDKIITNTWFQNRTSEKLLELGCGTGKNTVLFAGLSSQVSSVDFSDGMLTKARESVAATNVSFFQADITQPLPFPADEFDCVTCNLTLEHVEHLVPVFKNVYDVMIENACFFISELHPYRQYKGSVANFSTGETHNKITAYTHHISDFIQAAESIGFTLGMLHEWWHELDEATGSPRLISFAFVKRSK